MEKIGAACDHFASLLGRRRFTRFCEATAEAGAQGGKRSGPVDGVVVTGSQFYIYMILKDLICIPC